MSAEAPDLQETLFSVEGGFDSLVSEGIQHISTEAPVHQSSPSGEISQGDIDALQAEAERLADLGVGSSYDARDRVGLPADVTPSSQPLREKTATARKPKKPSGGGRAATQLSDSDADPYWNIDVKRPEDPEQRALNLQKIAEIRRMQDEKEIADAETSGDPVRVAYVRARHRARDDRRQRGK